AAARTRAKRNAPSSPSAGRCGRANDAPVPVGAANRHQRVSAHGPGTTHLYDVPFCVQVMTVVRQTSPTRTVCRMPAIASAAVKSVVLRPSVPNLILFALTVNLPLRQPGEPGTLASLFLNFHFSFGSFCTKQVAAGVQLPGASVLENRTVARL